MVKTSVVIITENEEANIRRCLESVKWADEIIVVDSGSTDTTLDICKEYECKVFHREWDGYANQKNYALDQASGDWILSLDADEEVTSELAKELWQAVNSDSADAYSIPRLNNFLGRWMRHGGWYPDRQLRFFKRNVGRFKVIPLHECVEIKDPSVRLGKLSAPLRHYTYQTVADFIKKADRYTSIEADAMIKEGRLPKSITLSLIMAIPSKFVEVYFYKGGWRDGLHGFIAAVLMSARVFLRYVKLWEALGVKNGVKIR